MFLSHITFLPSLPRALKSVRPAGEDGKEKKATDLLESFLHELLPISRTHVINGAL